MVGFNDVDFESLDSKRRPNTIVEGRSTMTASDIAKYLGISKDMVYKLTREKRIPFLKIGGRILFKKYSIDKWLDELEYIPE